MDDHQIFLAYCLLVRERLKARGVLMYNGAARKTLSFAGWPYARISAVNDNEAKP